MKTTLRSLTVNHLREPFGVERPVFGWKLDTARPGAAQVAYRVTLEVLRRENGAAFEIVWDSGEVVSARCSAIPYCGPVLEMARRYRWTVSVKDETGVWSEPAESFFESSLGCSGASLCTDDLPFGDEPLYDAKWIAVEKEASADFDTSFFLKKVENRSAVAEAWWFVSGGGVFEAYVNGEPVSHKRSDGSLVRDILKPGFTHPFKRRHYFSYDVTHLVNAAQGESNVLSALVTGGWWRDKINGHRQRRSAFWGTLVLRYADGSVDFVNTDTSWHGSHDFSPVRRADIHYGEDFDATRLPHWRQAAVLGDIGDANGPVADGWGAVREDDQVCCEPVPLKGPAVRYRDDLALAPQSIRVWSGVDGAEGDHYGRIRVLREYRDGEEIVLRPGEHLQLDFGQNAAAVPEILAVARGGARYTVRVAEMLNDGNGAVSRYNDGPEGELYKHNYREARSEARYIFGSEGETAYRPQFSFIGYRYVSIEAQRFAVTIKRVRSIPVTSVAAEDETGSLETGLPILNRLVANGYWGQLSNYLSVPTDCPQRDERLGWSADTQVFTTTACCNAEVYGFLSKWMDDMDDSQHEDGGYPGVAPFAQYGNQGGCVGWADAGIIVPYVLWRRYGDTRVVADNFAGMTKYIDLIDRLGGPHPEPWGDWLAYERNDIGIKRYLSGAFWVWDAMMMREMAAAIGRPGAEKRFAESERKARAAFTAKFLDADGRIKQEFRCQTAAIYALYLDLVEGDAAADTKRDLLENIKAHGDRLQTGFLGTAIIMDTLTKIGASDVAYTLLLQHDEPSWLYSIDQGATTFWERWNSYTKEAGFGNAGMNSFNHYAYGAVVSWLYGTMAGIRPDPATPGFGHFILAPRPDPRVPSVSASLDTPCGRVESAWRYDEKGAWHWRYVVPANTTATVTLPDGTVIERAAGTYEV
ncbi:MAG: family 78 glycoside hydrolase catalytic domain [Kiritimatiellae bacterium]|nr:family 78 glycoside hydrolase catalytic domain [Kiritimatiellia bacterium]